ncbi:hypothetical protein ACP4OV_023984 [Aristida adscensionis]
MQGSSSSSCVIPSDDIRGADPPPARRIVAAHRLPLRAVPDPDSPFGLAFSLDPDALPLQLSRGLPAPVTFVGALPASAASAAPSDELDAYLLENFSCLPVSIDGERHAAFYDGFCKRYLWPLLHCTLPHGDLGFDAAAYTSFLAVNRKFADRVVEVLSPENGDLVVVHDYHLWVLPAFLRRKCPHAGVGFFLHSPFPCDEFLDTSPVRGVLLRALLNADLVGFHTFDHASHFLSSCFRRLGVSYGDLHRGHISLGYHGRTVLVTVLAVGVDVGHLRAALASPEAAAKAREIADAYRGRMLMVGVDDVDLFKGVDLKLLAMERLLDEYPDMRGHVVLVQINNPARTRGRDIDSVRGETETIRRRVNSRFGTADYSPVVVVDGPVPMSEKAAYYAAAECCVVSAVRDGLNRIPYFYTVCREGGPAGAAVADGGDSPAQGTSAVVLSEFAGCSPSLGGAFLVNPWNVRAVAEAMYDALTMRAEDKQASHRRRYSYLVAHDAVAWARSFDEGLRLACERRTPTRFIGVGFGMSYRAVAVDASSNMLRQELGGPAYRAAARRLNLLDNDETVEDEESLGHWLL